MSRGGKIQSVHYQEGIRMSISRRSFLKSSAAATALSMTAGAAKTVLGENASTSMTPGPGNKWPGRVAINFNKAAQKGTASNPQVDETVCAKMVDDAIKLLTGKSTVGEAWKEIFPADQIKATSKIAIKTEFYNNKIVCPHWSSLLAIAKGLAQMDFGGTPFPLANITIYESNTPSGHDFAAAGYTAANFQGITLKMDSQQTYSDAATGESKYCTSLNTADFLICVFGCRGHSEYAENVTLGFKNHWGTYPPDMGKHTAPGFSVRVANMMSTGAIYKKNVLNVCSAMFSNNENNAIDTGPQSFATYAAKMDSSATSTTGACTIVMSTDPISAEMQAIKILRMNKEGGKTGVTDMPKYLQACAGKSGVLSVNYNIGVIDETQMTIKKMINEVNVTPVAVRKNSTSLSSDYSLHISPLNKQGTVFIEFAVPASRLGSKAVLSMYDILGNLVFSHEQSIHGALNQFSWDRRTAQGKVLGHGKYVCKLTVENVSRSVAFAIV
jgi:hypothetical protein